MGLTTCIASSDAYLTTTSAVKLRLGTTLTSDDAYLSDLILEASRWAESYVGYPLTAAAYVETLPAFGTQRLVVSRTPVRVVSGLFHGTDSGSYAEVNSSEYRVDAGAGFVERAAGFAWTAPALADLVLHPVPGQELIEWRSEYVAGYTRGVTTDSPLYSTAGKGGSTSTGRTLPEDIEAAVIARTVQLFESGGGEDIVERAIGDLRVRFSSFGGTGVTTMSQAERLLAPYRRY